jgi:hypothetical protein
MGPADLEKAERNDGPEQCSQFLVIGGYLLMVARYCYLWE